METDSFFDQNTMKETPKPKKSRNRFKIVLGIILILIVAAFLLVKPAIIGYSVYGEVKNSGLSSATYSISLQDALKNLENTQNDLTQCTQKNIEAEAGLKEAADQLSTMKSEQDTNLNIIHDKMSQITEIQSGLENAENKLKLVKNNYDDLAKNTARSICCKQKVDNENINYFDIDDDKIICKEDSGEPLSCW
ncbi:MAG: hypothetical protein ABIJ34_00825 [archaeon]